MAKNSPSFQFYPADFLVGTMHFDATEVGVYCRLLCYQWARTRLDNDEEMLAKLAGVPLDDFKRIWKTVREKFELSEEDNCWRNPRMARDIADRASRSRQNSVNGSKGGRKRKATAKRPLNERNGTASETFPSNADSGEVDKWEFPESWQVSEVLIKALDDWADMRKSVLRKPIRSRKSTSKQFKHFDGPDHLLYCAEFCEANSYQGLKPDYRPSTARNRRNVQQELVQRGRL